MRHDQADLHAMSVEDLLELQFEEAQWQEASDAAVLLFVRAMWLVIGAMTYGLVVRLIS